MKDLQDVFTPEVIASIKKQRTNRETTSKPNTRRAIKVALYEDNKYIQRFSSISKCATYLGVSSLTVSNNLLRGHSIAGGKYQVKKVW